MDVHLSPEGRFLSAMLRVHKDQYDLVVVEVSSLKEVQRWVYKRYIRESWPLLKFS